MNERQEPISVPRRIHNFVQRRSLALTGSIFVGTGINDVLQGDYATGGFKLGGGGLLIGANAFYNRYRRLSAQSYSEGLVNPDAFNLDVLENSAALLLELNLGIEYPDPPTKIAVTGSNMARIARRDPARALLLRNRMRRTEHGIYDPNNNTVFVKKNISLTQDLGLNMSTFIKNTNSDFIETSDKAVKVLTDAGMRETQDVEIIEQDFVYNIIDNGLSQWSTGVVLEEIIEARKQLGPEWIEGLRGTMKDYSLESLRYEAAYGRVVIRFPNPPDNALEIAKDKVAILKTALIEEDNAAALVEVTTDAFNYIGTYAQGLGNQFIISVMDYVSDFDITLGEAIMRIIAHPPKSFAELADPEHYAHEKILGQNE